MAKLTKKDVQHVADLANLTLTEAEIEKFEEQLSNIVGYVSKLDEVDTTNLEPTSQTTGLKNVLRTDQIIPSSLDRAGALSGSSDTHNGLFKVKAILTERTDK